MKGRAAKGFRSWVGQARQRYGRLSRCAYSPEQELFLIENAKAVQIIRERVALCHQVINA